MTRPERFDVVVVGARCAGATLATHLARRGLRVCLLDRARFPSDTPSTHAVQPAGARSLDRLGVLDRVLECSPAIDRARLVLDGARIELDGATETFGAPMVNARRVRLDEFLLEAARTAGADVRTRTAVTGLLEEDGRVVGVTTDKARLRAPLVVGADGARSTVARLVGAEEYCATDPGRLFLWGYFHGVQRAGERTGDTIWLGRVGEYGYLASPTDDELFLAVVTVSSDREKEVLADRAAAHAAGVRAWPELEGILAPGRREGPVRAMSRWHGFFRRSAGRGWALVGDAGHFKDPTPGQGIADALRQSEQLAEAVAAGLDGGGQLDEELERWWAWRDQDAWEMYWFAHDLGAPGVTPVLTQEVLRGAAGDPERTRRLFRILNHDLPPSRLVTPTEGLAAVSRALRRPGERRTFLREAGTTAADELYRRRLQRRVSRGRAATPAAGTPPPGCAATRPRSPGARPDW